MPVTFPVQLTKPSLVKNKKLVAALGSPSLERDIALLEHTFGDSYFVVADPDKLGKETADPKKFERNRDGFKKVVETQRKKIETMAERLENDLTGINRALVANKKADKKVKAYSAELLKAAHGFVFALKPVATNELVYLIEKSFKAHLVGDMARQISFGSVLESVPKLPERHKKLLAEIAGLRSTPTVDAVHEMWKSGSSTARNYYIGLSSTWDQGLLKSFPSLAVGAPFSGAAQAHYVKLPWLADVANEETEKASKQLRAALGGSEDEKHVVLTMLKEYKDSVEEMWKLYPALKTAWTELSKWK